MTAEPVPNEIRNDPKKFRNAQMFDLIRQQIANLLLQYPELEEDEQLRSDMIEGETDAFEFLHLLECKRQDTETLIEGLDSRIAELKARQLRFDRREEAIRRLMFGVMQIAHIQKAELAEATLSIRNGTPKVIITDEATLPEMYWRIKREPDKTKLKEDMTQGYSIAGAELSNAEPTLSIRTK